MRRYRLNWGLAFEYVDADSPADAVANRSVERLPDTITDMTAIAEWKAGMGSRQYADLRSFEPEQPVARFTRAKEL